MREELVKASAVGIFYNFINNICLNDPNLNKNKKPKNYSCKTKTANLLFKTFGSCYLYNSFTVKNNNMQGLHGGDSRYSLPHSKNTQIKQKIGLKNTNFSYKALLRILGKTKFANENFLNQNFLFISPIKTY